MCFRYCLYDIWHFDTVTSELYIYSYDMLRTYLYFCGYLVSYVLYHAMHFNFTMLHFALQWLMGQIYILDSHHEIFGERIEHIMHT